MFWVKFIVGVIVFLLVLLLGLQFASINTAPVTVSYLLGTVQQPLALVIVWAFFLGFLLTALVSLLIVMPLRWRLTRLQHTVASQRQEIDALLRKSGRGA